VECTCLAGFELVGGDDDATKNNCADILECAASSLQPLRCAPCAIGRVRLIVHDTVRPPRCGLSRGRARCGDPATPEESPCQNGAACEEGRLDYTCACAAGFDGDDCENDVNECASRPCLHEGACYEGDAPPRSGRRLAAWDSPIASTPAPEPSAGRRLQDGDTGDTATAPGQCTDNDDESPTCRICMTAAISGGCEDDGCILNACLPARTLVTGSCTADEIGAMFRDCEGFVCEVEGKIDRTLGSAGCEANCMAAWSKKQDCDIQGQPTAQMLTDCAMDVCEGSGPTPDSFGCACVAGWAGDVCEVPTSQRNLD
jgi:Notch-like protein